MHTIKVHVWAGFNCILQWTHILSDLVLSCIVCWDLPFLQALLLCLVCRNHYAPESFPARQMTAKVGWGGFPQHFLHFHVRLQTDKLPFLWSLRGWNFLFRIRCQNVLDWPSIYLFIYLPIIYLSIYLFQSGSDKMSVSYLVFDIKSGHSDTNWSNLIKLKKNVNISKERHCPYCFTPFHFSLPLSSLPVPFFILSFFPSLTALDCSLKITKEPIRHAQ